MKEENTKRTPITGRVAVFRAAFDRFNSTCTDSELFHGYRLLAVDGTTVNLPRNPKAPSFVQNDGIPKGVNQLHVTPFYDILSRTFTDLVIQPEPRKDENGALVEMLKRNTFTQKTLIIADRGFESYNLIAHCLEKENVDFLIRVRQNYSAMREIRKRIGYGARGRYPTADKWRLRLQGEFQNGSHALQGAFANAEHGRRKAVKRNRAVHPFLRHLQVDIAARLVRVGLRGSNCKPYRAVQLHHR